MLQARLYLSGQEVHLSYAVNLIAEKLDADHRVSGSGGYDLDDIASHSEGSSLEIHLIADVLEGYQPLDHLVAVFYHAGPEGDGHVLVIDGASEGENAADRAYDDHVVALRKGCRRRVAKPVYLVVDR